MGATMSTPQDTAQGKTEEEIYRANLEKAEQYFAKESENKDQTVSQVSAGPPTVPPAESSTGTPAGPPAGPPAEPSKVSSAAVQDDNVIVTQTGKFYQKISIFPKRRHIPNLFINDGTGKLTIYRDMFTTDTVEDLVKKIIRSKRMTPASVSVTLKFDGQILKNLQKTIGDYGIGEDSTVYVKLTPIQTSQQDGQDGQASKSSQSSKSSQNDNSEYVTRYGRVVRPTKTYFQPTWNC